jgi:Ca2+/Na+ antiporter
LCHSSLFVPGVFLLGEGPLAFLLIILLLYLFIGLSVVSEIMQGAIAQIMSEKKTMTTIDIEGNNMTVGVAMWNPRIANVTLLAIGSSAPEILLGFFSTLGTGGTATLESGKKVNPSALGPMIMIASAAFNLLVTCGVSILAVDQIKRIEYFKSFLVTFGFSCFAYLWMFLVLYIISPA